MLVVECSTLLDLISITNISFPPQLWPQGHPVGTHSEYVIPVPLVSLTGVGWDATLCPSLGLMNRLMYSEEN